MNDAHRLVGATLDYGAKLSGKPPIPWGSDGAAAVELNGVEIHISAAPGSDSVLLTAVVLRLDDLPATRQGEIALYFLGRNRYLRQTQGAAFSYDEHASTVLLELLYPAGAESIEEFSATLAAFGELAVKLARDSIEQVVQRKAARETSAGAVSGIRV